jgi:hypothetical protein
MTGPLQNPRHERYAQGIAAGMSQIDAYVAAGYARNEGRASRLRQVVQVRERIAQLTASSAQAVAIASSATARQELIRAGYDKLRVTLWEIEVDDAQAWKALADAVLALDKDQRVTTGGLSDRIATTVVADDRATSCTRRLPVTEGRL